ncbi:hypothetical protein NXU89_12940 [Bacteroides uniformis]|nr:hypothetical protein [Bacteroides uniformis]
MFAAALTLTGCDYNEDHFPGYDELAQPKDVWNDTITLADADYKTIAGIEANKELALSTPGRRDLQGGFRGCGRQ